MATYKPQDDSIWTIDNTAGTPTDVSDYVKSGSFDISQVVSRFAVLGQRWKQLTRGTSEAKGELTAYGSVDTGGLHYIATHWLLNAPTVKPVLKSLKIQEPDAAVGSFQFDMEIALTSYKEVMASAGEANPSEHQLQFEIDGAPVWTVIT